MTVYVDVVFLLNFLIDFLLLWLTMLVRKQRSPYWRIGVGALIGAFYTVALFVPGWHWLFPWLTKLLISALMVFVAFGYRSYLSFLRNWGMFYFISFVIGGGMFAAHYILLERETVVNGAVLTEGSGMGSPITWTFVVFGFPLMWWYSRLTFRSLNERQMVQRYLVTVELTVNGRTVRGTGLIDTGNQLRDPLTRTPVIVAEVKFVAPLLPDSFRDLLKDKDFTHGIARLPVEWMKRVKLIPFRGVSRDGDLMVAFKPDKVRIVSDEKMIEGLSVFVGLDGGCLSSDGTYQVIVHPSCLEEAS